MRILLLFLFAAALASAQWSQISGAFTNVTNAVGNSAQNFGRTVANSTRNFFSGPSSGSDQPLAPPVPVPPMYNQCSLSDPSGYSLSWQAINNALIFNLTYTNFPRNSWTGVGWGPSMDQGIDAILVQTSGNNVQVLSASVLGEKPPVPDSSNIATTYSSSYRGSTLRASFSRPIDVDGMPSLNNCNVWDFIVNAGGFNNGQYTMHSGVPRQYTICNVASMCGNNNGITNGMSQGSNAQYNVNNQMFAQGSNVQYNGNNQYGNQVPSNNGQMQGNNRQYNPAMQQSQMMPGQGYGYVPNTATPPSDRPYTGAPYQYTTTMNPTLGTGESSMNGKNTNMGQSQYYGGQGSNYNGNMMRNPPNQNQNQYSGQMPPNSNQQYQYPPQFNLPQPISPYPPQGQYGPMYGRKKRQSSTYQPTNNIYGYDYNSGSGSATSAPLVVNPNYAYLNDQLASEYAQTYGTAVRAYEQNPGSMGPASNPQPNFYNQGYVAYDAPILSNQQQNQQNYGYISQQNGYQSNGYSSGSSTYNNGLAYNPSSGSTSSGYVSPMLTGNVVSNQQNPYLSSSYNTNNGQNGVFYNPPSTSAQFQTATPVYQSINNLHTTNFNASQQVVFRDNYGDYVFPTNASANQIVTNPQYTGSTPSPFQSVRGKRALRFSQYATSYATTTAAPYPDVLPGGSVRFFDQTGNNTEMYYPYRFDQPIFHYCTNPNNTVAIYHDSITATNFNPPINAAPYFDGVYNYNGMSQSGSSSGGYVSGVQYDQNGNMITGNNQVGSNLPGVGGNPCALTDPYWCQDYVNVYISSDQTYNQASLATACQQLVSSLRTSYNQCCNTVRSAGCQV